MAGNFRDIRGYFTATKKPEEKNTGDTKQYFTTTTNDEKDSRFPCKYGAKCYQTNPAHHEKYRHPEKRIVESINEQSSVKRKKLEESKDEIKHFHTLPDNDSGQEKKTHSSGIEDNVSIPGHSKECNSIETAEQEKKEGRKESKIFNRIRTLSENKSLINDLFLVEMPDDFYSFWDFCESSCDALASMGLKLVGPYDILSGLITGRECEEKTEYLCHWRYYYDPPEFQTVLKGEDRKQFHIGYFRDDPKELPCFVASNSAGVDCVIKPFAKTLFGAVNAYLEEIKLKADPFRKPKINSFQNSLRSFALTYKITLETNTPDMKERSRKVVCKTFHKAGMVVPWNKKTELGYRELIVTEAKLKQMLKRVVESDSQEERSAHFGKLQEVITAANIASDECDFGTALELGLDLFSFGGDVFHNTILHLMCTAYDLLGRSTFITILKAHLKNRRKSGDLSIIQRRSESLKS